MDNIFDTFHNTFTYAILYISWDGLRIIKCENEQDMDKKFDEYSKIYTYIRKIKVEDINI